MSLGGLLLTVIAIAVVDYFAGLVWLAVFLALLVLAVVFHFFKACRKCTNLACSANLKSPDCIFRIGRSKEAAGDKTTAAECSFSDINSALVVLPLALALAVGLVGTWFFSPWATIIITVAFVVFYVPYYIGTCRFCTNNCPLNQNQAYRDWKRETT